MPTASPESTMPIDTIRKKVEAYERQSSHIKRIFEEGNYKKVVSLIEPLKKTIKRKREEGLEDDGEMSVENLTYKVLRNKGFFDELRELYKKAYDNSYSIYEKFIITMMRDEE